MACSKRCASRQADFDRLGRIITAQIQHVTTCEDAYKQEAKLQKKETKRHK